MNKRIAWLVAMVCVLLASVASAAGKARGVVIIIEGSDVEATRRDLIDAIPDGLQVLSAGDLYAAFGTHGVDGSLADSLANPRTRKQTLTGVRKSLADAGVSAVISARSKKIGRGGGRDVRVVLMVASQTEPVLEENISIGKGERGAQKLQPLLSVPLQDVASAPAPASAAAPASEPSKKVPAPAKEKSPEPSVASAAETEDAPAEKDEVAKPRAPVDFSNAMILVEAGGGAGRRSFEYTSMVKGALRSYTAPGVAFWSAGAEVYPLADKGVPVAKDLGVVGRLSGSFRWDSKTADGTSAAGTWARYAVGLRGRIHLGEGADAPLLGIEGTYGDWRFDFEGEGNVATEVPSVDYHYVRGGADLRVPFGAFHLLAGAGYVHVLSGGPFTDRFPHAKMMGVDARIGAAYSVVPWLQIKAMAEYERVASHLNPKLGEGTPAVAGGSLDQYFIANLGVSAIF